MQDRVNDPAARRRVLDALRAVLSDDHNYELGLATLRDLMDHTVRQDGATALSDLTCRAVARAGPGTPQDRP